MLPTTGVWMSPGEAIARSMKGAGYRTSEGVVGFRNLAVVALPLVAGCSRTLHWMREGAVQDSITLALPEHQAYSLVKSCARDLGWGRDWHG